MHPALAKSYPANVATVVLSLFPGLINTSAIAIVQPVIGRDFGVSADVVGRLPLLSDAALAFGCLLAAELARRVPNRPHFFWLLGLSLVTSAGSALAPSFGFLLIAQVLHGLLAGMLFVVMLPPLLTVFGSAKIQATATVLVPSLFGAATLGPVAGGLLAEPTQWRWLFGMEVVLAIAALVLGALSLEPRTPPPTDDPVDWPALALAAIGATAIIVGVGNLASHNLSYGPAFVPVALGVAAFVALFAVEALRAHPLVPVRRLLTSVALVGAIATIVGSACFAAAQQSIIVGLERLDGLTPHQAGLALWPEFLAAMASGIVFGRLVPTRWLLGVGTVGLAIMGAAALAAEAAMPLRAASSGAVAFALGLGSGLCVTPGLFTVALSFERAAVARAIALLNMLRLTGGFISGPGVENTIGTRVRDALFATHPELRRDEGIVRSFIVTGAHPGIDVAALQAALEVGLRATFEIVALLAFAACIVNAVLLVVAHVPLRRPDLGALDDGRPAIVARV